MKISVVSIVAEIQDEERIDKNVSTFNKQNF